MTALAMQALALILVAALASIGAFFAMNKDISKWKLEEGKTTAELGVKVDLILKMVEDMVDQGKDVAVLKSDVLSLKEWRRDMNIAQNTKVKS